MKRLMRIFGAVLIVLAFTILTIFIIAPAIIMPLDNAPLLKSIMQAAVCSSNETLTAEYSTYTVPGSSTTSISYHCVDGEQNAREVGDDIIKAGGISYVVLFLIGLFTFLSSTQDSDKKSKAKAAAAQRAEQMARAEQLEALVEAGGKGVGVSASRHNHSQSDHIPLAQQLQELKDALDAGLITEAEYKAKRLELLS
ncbi:MAG: hypothetical protein GC204_20275 [Chloroflexi bacterium]|nr:hypothetical protein [Chloroflexota bacterium]